MYRYDIICEALQEQIEDGEITLEFAEMVNDLAYERYVIEKELTAEEREGRKRKAKLIAKIAAGIALCVAIGNTINNVVTGKYPNKDQRAGARYYREKLDKALNELKELKKHYDSMDTISQAEYEKAMEHVELTKRRAMDIRLSKISRQGKIARKLSAKSYQKFARNIDKNYKDPITSKYKGNIQE